MANPKRPPSREVRRLREELARADGKRRDAVIRRGAELAAGDPGSGRLAHSLRESRAAETLREIPVTQAEHPDGAIPDCRPGKGGHSHHGGGAGLFPAKELVDSGRARPQPCGNGPVLSGDCRRCGAQYPGRQSGDLLRTPAQALHRDPGHLPCLPHGTDPVGAGGPRLLTEDTVDEAITALLRQKQALFDEYADLFGRRRCPDPHRTGVDHPDGRRGTGTAGAGPRTGIPFPFQLIRHTEIPRKQCLRGIFLCGSEHQHQVIEVVVPCLFPYGEPVVDGQGSRTPPW